MPPKTPYPTPVLRLHNGAWKIVWNYGGKQYSVSTGLPEGEKVFAEKWRADFAIALKQDIPSFPERFADSSGVERYIETRYGTGARSRASTGNWLADYEIEIKSECAKKWAHMSIVTLQKFDAAIGGIAKANPDNVSKYLAGIAEKQKPATRNRTLNIFSRFFNWAVRTHRTKTNPATGIKRLKEEKSADIVHCTPEEREEIISLAQNTGRPEWMAVPLAFYSGMRREEISRLEWPHIRFRQGLLVVMITKTEVSRTLPLNAKLESLLKAVPEKNRKGFVVTISDELDRLWRLDNLIRTIQKTKRSALLTQWDIPKPPPSRAKDYDEKKTAWLEAKKNRDVELKETLGRIGWNSFRHTFGSLLAQSGVSIDKISSWMGNTPEVCRRHYAQFVPRDRRDDEIDKL